MTGKFFGITEQDIKDRLNSIAEMSDTYVIELRKNPDLCENCEQLWPVYRYRRWWDDLWRPWRTYCACGYAQYPNLRRWNALSRLESEWYWVQHCWAEKKLIPRWAWFPRV